jgi:Ca2+/Na+ antiporter
MKQLNIILTLSFIIQCVKLSHRFIQSKNIILFEIYFIFMRFVLIFDYIYIWGERLLCV